jgi:predicted lipid-binding transport protein (Tim44 family)
MATRTAGARASRKSAKPSRTKSRTTATRVGKPNLRAGASPQLEVGMLGGLVLAMVLGGLGFIVSVFWVGAIVVMAILVGLTVAERRGAAKRGVVTEVVAAVVDEVQGVSESAARLKGDRSS